ncbi:hypothetical protein IWZ00DRAFT_15811 [Phyllosticta capitalensis]|uniref:Uncharacterized protein n=1 Tax=Phyllosticta capitalensis TaxID=121624 RepID=A0ABR1Z2I4_9PEZI
MLQKNKLYSMRSLGVMLGNQGREVKERGRADGRIGLKPQWVLLYYYNNKAQQETHGGWGRRLVRLIASSPSCILTCFFLFRLLLIQRDQTGVFVSLLGSEWLLLFFSLFYSDNSIHRQWYSSLLFSLFTCGQTTMMATGVGLVATFSGSFLG